MFTIRTLPADDLAMRAALVRRAIDLLGTATYAAAMGVSERTARSWAKEGGDKDRPVSDDILRRTGEQLVLHRQRVAALVRGVKSALGEQEDGAGAARRGPAIGLEAMIALLAPAGTPDAARRQGE